MRISEAPAGGWLYLIALGSNQRHHRYGGPRAVLAAAMLALREAGVTVLDMAPVIDSAPIGPSLRRYANGAALVRSTLEPVAMLGLLQEIEAAFGRKRARRWGSRVLDLDIVLWEGGRWLSGGASRKALHVPHPAYRERGFVLAPTMAIAAGWRDPLTGFTPRHLHSRLTARARIPRDAIAT
ncbi:2-amino-4-hydroxy-6-hydroxymethyldihydropteridine diphosphokinase [Novosphingobium rosa]|uniref:2-amino-4-hydroxy-6- hydroxymethyldihydropteridine diphosphokinase n=1 Tax=Novosphingobium rosa TaxID=76978 RepID=UPI0027D82ABB|nr:2-amino-4-hydroxy-6-hydroxymethyldihydropteridine diphosphokinase [Novosphingobium rosa]